MGGNQISTNSGFDNRVETNRVKHSEAPDGTSNETLPLSHFVNPALIDTLLQQIDSENPTGRADLTYRYFPYGHNTVGTFNIQLAKTINTDEESYYAPGRHGTTETGEDTNDYESGTVDLKVGSETKKVVQIGDEMTTSGGKITVQDLSYAPDGAYYLEETKAPDGYIISESPMTIHLTLKDKYTDYKDPYPEITDISNTPYNWTQTVQKLAYTAAKDGTGDSEKFVVEVLNNPGVELPSTGGPGTNMIYIFGLLLTGLAGAGLMMKRRKKIAA